MLILRPEKSEKISRIYLIAWRDLGLALEKISISTAYMRWEIDLEGVYPPHIHTFLQESTKTVHDKVKENG